MPATFVPEGNVTPPSNDSKCGEEKKAEPELPEDLDENRLILMQENGCCPPGMASD